jgi:hypothetical protein
VDVALVGGWEVVSDFVISLSVSLNWQDDVTIAGDKREGSQKIDPGMALALSWRFDPHWTLQASLGSWILADAAAKNSLGRITSTLGLRYGFF